MHKIPVNKLVIATHNPGKLRVFRDLLAPYVKDVVSSGELGLPEPEETGKTFLENAIIKARAAAEATGHVALADDGGLCVNALNGRPGLHSARWAGPDKDYSLAMRRVHDELGSSADRSAYFVCVQALFWPDGHVETAEGRCDGMIVWPPRGKEGYHYDPFFVPEGSFRTFGEMGFSEERAFSPHVKALKVLLQKHFSDKTVSEETGPEFVSSRSYA